MSELAVSRCPNCNGVPDRVREGAWCILCGGDGYVHSVVAVEWELTGMRTFRQVLDDAGISLSTEYVMDMAQRHRERLTELREAHKRAP